MGFISNIAGVVSDSINSELNDQFLESFRCDSLGQDTLVKRAVRQNSFGRNQGNADIISAGSKVLVPEGTYALMIDNGQIVDSVSEPGLYTWENSSSASVLSGNVKSVMGDVFDRFRFAGEVTKSQKIFFVNALEIMNQTCKEYLNVPYPDPFYGNLYFKFRIMFSFRIVDPVRFFKKTGKFTTVYDYMGSPERPKQPILEVQDHMEEALNLCAVRDKVPFPQLLSNKSKVKDAVNDVLSKLWREQRGMVIETIALTDLTLDEASRKRVEQFDSAKLFGDDPAALNALIALGLTDAVKAAASNPAGAVGGFAGIGMAAGTGTLSGNSVPVNSVAAANAANYAAAINAVNPAPAGQSFTGPETCPFCGTVLPSQAVLEHCPACNADIRSYFRQG